ncbi:MAG TPA: hypothetical protein VEL74_03405 [Thermoanaerobaculia bacterium]|nr:hypothetical protein [Thermoanaerobaculia bacterium]
MKMFLKSIAAFVFLALVIWAIRSDSLEERGNLGAAPLAGAAVPAGDPAWRRAPLWDDGKSEFCAYEATWPRYGHRFEGRALLVLVKEPWAPDLNVKADNPRPGGFEVLKLNHVRDVPTGIYSYHQMASVYSHRESGALVKLAATSAEACGISGAEMVGGRLATRSYFDGQGDRSLPWPAEALPEDGLPAALRDYVTGPVPDHLSVFPSLMASRLPELAPSIYKVERRAAGEVETPAGASPGVEIRLTRGKSWLSYTFEAEAPHRLLRLQSHDGTEYRLAKCDRIAYWQMHNPGDESWLPESTR